MACAGYLVRNNSSVVYAEITNGLLVWATAKSHCASHESTPGNVLPPLAPKHMKRRESRALPKLKLKSAEPQPEEEDEVQWSEQEACCGDDEDKAGEATELQLSGHAIDVIDCDDDFDDGLPLLPFSFRVKTKKMTLHGDGSFTSAPIDSLLLAAVDQKAKDEWMKRLARWNRYGWRETTPIAATEAELEALKINVACWRDDVAAAVGLAASPHGFPTSATHARSTRRRFYRSTGMDALEDSTAPSDAWFSMRVVKTHI